MILPNPSSLNRDRQTPTRSGFTLVELLAVLAIAFAILMIIFTMLNGVIHAISASGEQSVRFENVQQTASRIRQLAHESASAELIMDGRGIVFRSIARPETVTTIKIVEKPLRLEFERAGGSGRSVQGLSGLASGRFVEVKQEDGLKPLIQLELWPHNRVGNQSVVADPIRPLHIEAVVGLLARPADTGEKPKP